MESNALLHLRQQQQQQQQQVRQRRVEDACARYNDSWNWQDAGKSFVVSHKLRVIFCMLGQSACTNWIRVLLQLTGDPAAQALAVADRASAHAMVGMYLQWTSIQNASRLFRPPFNDYYKFLFVREPLERLVSAYRFCTAQSSFLCYSCRISGNSRNFLEILVFTWIWTWTSGTWAIWIATGDQTLYQLSYSASQLNYASQIWLRLTPVAIVTKICDFQQTPMHAMK